MNKKCIKLELNDILNELRDENNRLLNELEFAKKFINLLETQRNYLTKCLTNCENCNQNKEIKEKMHFLENNFKSKVAKELVFNTKNVLKINQKLRENCLNENQRKNEKIIETKINSEIESNYNSEDCDSNNGLEDNHSNSSGEESIDEKTKPIESNSKAINLKQNRNRCIRKISNENDFISTTRVVAKKPKAQQFKCDFCDYSNSQFRRVERHINQIHLKIRPFVCELCGNGFPGKENLKTHLQTIHPNVEYFQCDYRKCTFGSKDSKYFKEHRLEHLKQKQSQSKKLKQLQRFPNLYNCKLCDYSSKRLYEVKGHVNRLHLFKCVKCCLTFNGTPELLQHKRFVHPNPNRLTHRSANRIKKKYSEKRKKPKLIKCKFCDFSDQLLSEVRYHQKRCHLFKCRECCLAFDGKAELLEHKKSIHGKISIDRYVCDQKECDYRTNDLRKFNCHILGHTGEKPYKCSYPGCGRAFILPGNMRQHEVRVHNSHPAHCQWPGCDAVVKSANMKRHLLVHKGVKSFECVWPGCESRFARRRGLTSHMLMHTNSKRIRCHWPQCDKFFNYTSDFRRHLLRHKGERPLKCPIDGCNRRFVEHGNRTRHLKTHRDKTK